MMLLDLIYVLLVVLTLPWWLIQSLRTGKYREGWRQKFWGAVPVRSDGGPCVWLHAVSVGEVNLLRPLIDELSHRDPTLQFAITTTTQTGYQLARAKYAEHLVSYAPLDFSWAVKRTLRRWNPSMLVLVELEIWPNLIRCAKQAGLPVAIVNGRLSERSTRGYSRWRRVLGPVLGALDVVGAQNERYAENFRKVGVRDSALQVTGSIKFDGARSDRQHPETRALAQIAEIGAGDLVFLAGSTQAPEEELALQAYQTVAARYPQLRLILVPRHPERFDEVAAMLRNAGVPWSRRSELDGEKTCERILLVDAVGELGAWWGTAGVAFVGGSMGTRGGQNMIEPAAYGMPICFGPQTRNFRDVVEVMLAQDAARVVHDLAQLTAFLQQACAEPDFARRLAHNARQLVQSQRGATARTADMLCPWLADRQHDPMSSLAIGEPKRRSVA